MRNIGYLTSGRGSESDHVYTPFCAVTPILKYIPKKSVVWCPFDAPWSSFVQSIGENGNAVIYSHINAGQDFFEYTPTENFDVIISNPPFSIKDRVLERLYALQKPFARLLPLNALQGQKRFKYFKNGIQLLAFDKRIDYHTNENFHTYTKGNHFASGYFCKDFLPKDLILEELKKYDRSLKV